jgi:hypothetical protein
MWFGHSVGRAQEIHTASRAAGEVFRFLRKEGSKQKFKAGAHVGMPALKASSGGYVYIDVPKRKKVARKIRPAPSRRHAPLCQVILSEAMNPRVAHPSTTAQVTPASEPTLLAV